ncbi:MAG: hypothetical protein PF574_04700 [Candidatus Delongbacteria bacterium]|jgi:hypothetical protein|nr:hypothetical protein [Candidatus Delongbacteria bacterium]
MCKSKDGGKKESTNNNNSSNSQSTTVIPSVPAGERANLQKGEKGKGKK